MDKILLIIVAIRRIDAIKEVRSLTSWGLYEAKEAVENGMIFDDLGNMRRFMLSLQSRLGSDQVMFQCRPYRDAGPQDATGMNF